MNFRSFRGGVADNEIARQDFGGFVLRVLWFANGKHRVERYTYGDWERITPEMAKEICFCNFKAENWLRENTDLLG